MTYVTLEGFQEKVQEMLDRGHVASLVGPALLADLLGSRLSGGDRLRIPHDPSVIRDELVRFGRSGQVVKREPYRGVVPKGAAHVTERQSGAGTWTDPLHSSIDYSNR